MFTLDAILARLDPSALHPEVAVQILEEADGIERAASAIKAFVADRAVSSSDWTRSGHRSPEEWLATKTGSSYADAAKTLEASSKLKDLPAVDEALRSGKLSGAQLGELANATPENEATLLDSAQRDGFKGFKDRCAKARAARRTDEEEAARYARIRKDRFHRSWTDATGAYRYEGMTTADAGARLDAAIAAELEAVFRRPTPRDGASPTPLTVPMPSNAYSPAAAPAWRPPS